MTEPTKKRGRPKKQQPTEQTVGNYRVVKIGDVFWTYSGARKLKPFDTFEQASATITARSRQ